MSAAASQLDAKENTEEEDTLVTTDDDDNNSKGSSPSSPPVVGASGAKSKRIKWTIENRTMWSETEILKVLEIMSRKKVASLLSGRKMRNEQIFRMVEREMRSAGFPQKTYRQIWNKWNILKTFYTTSRNRRIEIPKTVSAAIYSALDRVLNPNPPAISPQQPAVEPVPTIVRIQGGVGRFSNDAKKSSPVSVSFYEMADSFAVQHPIFGCRLGVVKTEPVDFEYEPGTSQPPSQVSNSVANGPSNASSMFPPMPPLHTPRHPASPSTTPHHIDISQMPLYTTMSPPCDELPQLKQLPFIKIALPSKPLPIGQLQTSPPKVFTVTPTSMAAASQKRRLGIPTVETEDEMCSQSAAEKYDEADEDYAPAEAKHIKMTPNQIAYSRSMRELASKLKQMQEDLLADFFQKQKMLIEEEHRFQKQQDDLLLQSFENQTKMLLESTKSLLAPTSVYIEEEQEEEEESD